jgi:hypothetical protein
VRRRMFANRVSNDAGFTQALRWIVLVPMAAVAAAASHVVISLVFGAASYALTGSGTDADSALAVVASLIASAIMAYVFVFTAVAIAPRHRATVAQAMIGVGVAIAVIALYDVAFASTSVLDGTKRGSLASSLGFLSGLLVAGIRLRD